MSRLLTVLFFDLILLASAPSFAAQSDRRQPLNAASDSVSSTLQGSSRTELVGNVVIDQGSLNIQADLGTIHTLEGDLSHTNFAGSPVKLHQRLDDGSPMESVSHALEYDMITDQATFTGDVVIKKPGHTLKGQRVIYNMATGELRADGNGGSERVEMHIPPRKKAANLSRSESAPQSAN